jgi:uncharacterized Fe-S cluster-containing protein
MMVFHFCHFVGTDSFQLKDQILSLQAMLAQRPSAEELRSARETVRNVELLLAGANKENEKAMMETDRYVAQMI